MKNQPVSLSDALFSKAQARVSGLLFGNPGRSAYSTPNPPAIPIAKPPLRWIRFLIV
jgi:hypothetical protein